MTERDVTLFTYCPYCASPLVFKERGGRDRPVCPGCGYIQYRNPTVGVAVVLLEGDRILLGRRSPASSYAGRWCIPCGHVEWDEELRAAAVREFAEETGLTVELGEILAAHSNFHAPRRHTVGIWFAGTVVNGTLAAADDLDRVAYFPLDRPPRLAFPTDQLVIEQLRMELAACEQQSA